MTDLDALLAAVHASRGDDDGPHLVYADALQQCGDPRGEWIALQCTLARTPDDEPSWPDMYRRERELWRTHARAWWTDEVLEMRRGFPYRARSSADAVGLVRARLPTIEHVQVVGRAVREAAQVAGVSRLAVTIGHDEGQWLADADALALEPLTIPGSQAFGLPRPRALEALDIVVIPDQGDARADAVPPIVEGLRHLALARWDISPAAVRHRAGAFARLESLSTLAVPWPSALALAQAAQPGVLATLGIRAPSGEPRSALVGLPVLGGVRRLRLGGSALGSATLRQLLPCLTSVEVLELPRCALDAEAIEDLVAWPGAERLRVLDLASNRLSGEALAPLAGLPRLTRLCLSGNPLGARGAHELARSGLLDRLVVLDLDECRLDHVAFAALARALGPRLLKLTLMRNSPDPDAYAPLVAAPPEFQPVELAIDDHLARNELGRRYALAVRSEPPGLHVVEAQRAAGYEHTPACLPRALEL